MSLLKVKLKKLYIDTKVPVRGSLHAAAMDVFAHSIEELPNGKVKIGLGFATEIPKDYMGVIVPRSNITRHFWIMNNSYGVIDSDYRGEWMVIFSPLPFKYKNDTFSIVRLENEFPYQVGERVAQIYFQPKTDVDFKMVGELSDTERGIGGFGSTGIE